MESICGNMLKCCLGQRSARVLTKIWWLSSFSKILFVGSQSEINEQLKCLFRSTFRLFPFSFQPSNAQTHIRTPSIVFRIINFNQTMPTLVLDLESSSVCCYLALCERLLDQWGILKHSPQRRCIFISHCIGGEKSSRVHNMDLLWLKWIISITIWRELILSLFGSLVYKKSLFF